MRKTIEFEYDLGSEVKIISIGMIGFIDSMCFDSLGSQYRVVYWNDGVRCSVWMYPQEIKNA